LIQLRQNTGAAEPFLAPVTVQLNLS